MKALLQRFKNSGKGIPNSPPDPNFNTSREKEKLDLPPLRQWPPQPIHETSPNALTASRHLPPVDGLQEDLPQHSNSQTSSDSSPRTPHLSLARSPSRAPSHDDRAAADSSLAPTRTDLLRHESFDGSTPVTPPRAHRKTADQNQNQNQNQNTAPDNAQKKQVAFLSPAPTPIPLTRVLSEPRSESSRSMNAVGTATTTGAGADSGAAGSAGNNSRLNANGSSNHYHQNGSPSVAAANDSSSQSLRSGNPPLKTTVDRFKATHGGGSASSSRVNVSKGLNGNSVKGGSTVTRTPVSSNANKQYADTASLNPSMRSNTPYSQNSAASSRILATASWSEAAEDDLVSNIGPRERTRQEVLWEIVASEDRYVNELAKLKETFIDPLLHPYAAPPVCSPTPFEGEDYYSSRVDSPRESIDHLPIASRFLSATPRPETPAAKNNHPNIDGESFNTDEDEANDSKAYESPRKKRSGTSAVAAAIAKLNHPRSPYNPSSQKSRGPLPFPSRSHQSLPPPPRVVPQGSSTSLGRTSIYGAIPECEVSYAASQQTQTDKSTASRVLKKFRRTTPQPEHLIGDGVPPNQLPEDLRKCLEVLGSGVYEGHIALSEGLRKRYEEQYPLVRSLADVFVSNSHILREYATYVLHLERALEQVDAALSTAADKKPKNQDSAVWLKVCNRLKRLEQDAVEKGETGLAISLSKPFQRLLKYPLLFQNLLYHTDPSTFEYESTLQMVAEVEQIVRSIEDEKIQKEERDRTRDALARIEGLDKVKQLAAPKASRLLVEEKQIAPPPSQTQSQPMRPPPVSMTATSKNVKGKSSFRRLSDVLQTGQNAVGGKKDLWLVVFNDVVLRCQRTGITSLPLATQLTSRTNSLPDMQAKAKYATVGRKNMHTKPRNLYKFIKIENWDIAGISDPKLGVVSMDDVARSRQTVHSTAPTGRSSLLPQEEEDDGNESSDSDRKSKMSFSYWGADKVTIHKPPPKARTPASPGRRTALTPLGYGRESSANAKFGTRLVASPEPHRDYHPQVRGPSRRTQNTTPTSRRPMNSEDSHGLTSLRSREAARPAWDGSISTTRGGAGTATPTSTRTRARNISQTSGTPRTPSGGNTVANSKLLASPAPSADSGIGLYRQLMAQDSQLNGD